PTLAEPGMHATEATDDRIVDRDFSLRAGMQPRRRITRGHDARVMTQARECSHQLAAQLTGMTASDGIVFAATAGRAQHCKAYRLAGQLAILLGGGPRYDLAIGREGVDAAALEQRHLATVARDVERERIEQPGQEMRAQQAGLAAHGIRDSY